MASRNNKAPPRVDVPRSVVAIVLAWLLAIFVPMIARSPDLPRTLPPSSDRADMLAHQHARTHAAPAIGYLDESFDRVAEAAVRRDGTALGLARRDFVAMLEAATRSEGVTRSAVREHHLQTFIATVDHRRPSAVATIAARHGLLGRLASPGVDRAILVAWFDLFWETNAAVEVLSDAPVPLERLVDRIDLAERHALTAWALRSPCAALLGRLPTHTMNAGDARRCATARREFVALAAQLDGAYPEREALAAVEVLFAADLRAWGRTCSDPADQASAASAAREAYGRAHGLYALLTETTPRPLYQRYLRGTLAQVADDGPQP